MFVVQNNTEFQRYEIFEAGERAGFVQYEMHDGDMWVLYTQMRRKFKGAARAAKVMGVVLEDARRSRIRVVPFCPAFRVFLGQRPATPALVPEEWQERMAEAAGGAPDEVGRAGLKYIRLTGSPWCKSVAGEPAAPLTQQDVLVA